MNFVITLSKKQWQCYDEIYCQQKDRRIKNRHQFVFYDNKLSNCALSLADASREFQFHVSVRILTIKISQRARVKFCSYRKKRIRKLCFRDGLAWTAGLTVEMKLRFQILRRSVDTPLVSCNCFGWTQFLYKLVSQSLFMRQVWILGKRILTPCWRTRILCLVLASMLVSQTYKPSSHTLTRLAYCRWLIFLYHNRLPTMLCKATKVNLYCLISNMRIHVGQDRNAQLERL